MAWRRIPNFLMRSTIRNSQSRHDHTPRTPAGDGMQSTGVDQALTTQDSDVSSSTVQHESPRPTVPNSPEGTDRYYRASPTADSDLQGYEMLSHDQTKNFPGGESDKTKSLTPFASTAASNFDTPTLGRKPSPDLLEAPASTTTQAKKSMPPEVIPAAEEDYQGGQRFQPSRNNRGPRRKKGKQKIQPKSLRIMRWTVLENRVKLRELRNGLRNQRRRAIDADVAFMKALQAFTAENRSLQATKIMQLFEQSQRTRDIYQPLEDTYNDAEMLFDQRDFELGEMERTFYQREESQAVELDDAVDDLSEVSSLEDSTASIDSAPNFTDYAPVVIEYFSRIGDANLIHERLDDLRGHRAALVETQQLREPFGIPLDPESEQFLADFDAVHLQIQAQLADVEVDISRLRTACENEGFLDRNGTVQSISDDEDFLEFGTTRTGRDLLLLQDPNKKPTFSEISVDSTETMNKAKFIDRWLLIGLQGSGLEITRLKSMPDLSALSVNEEHLNELVLEWWPKDKATEAFLSRTQRAPGQSLTVSHWSEENTRRAGSVGQPRAIPFQGAPFSYRSF